MKKVLTIVAVVVVLLGVVGIGVDRAAASVAERTISEKIAQEFAGAGSVSTQVHGVPLLTQAATGSLDHVTVSLTGVQVDAGLALDSVDVELYDVSTSEPRTAASVEARASVSTAVLQAKLGDEWDVATDSGALVVSAASGLPVSARVVPVVRDGALAFDLESVSVLGLEVDGANVPGAIKDRVTALAGSIGALPLGLAPQSVVVTADGVDLVAVGTDVALESAR